jgi:hypothetical protein
MFSHSALFFVDLFRARTHLFAESWPIFSHPQRGQQKAVPSAWSAFSAVWSESGPPDNNITDAPFGYSTATLASSLGSGGANGGLNPLYQIGGPRSIQLALKLQF